jgi:hypothetical protein
MAPSAQRIITVAGRVTGEALPLPQAGRTGRTARVVGGVTGSVVEGEALVAGGDTVVAVVTGTMVVLAGLGDDQVKTSLLGRTLRVRCPPGVIVREIGEPTAALGESCDAQARSEVAVIVPVAA